MIDFGPNTGTADKLKTFLLVDRTVQVSNLGFLCVVLAFLFWFPIGLSRNVLYYAVGSFCFLQLESPPWCSEICLAPLLISG